MKSFHLKAENGQIILRGNRYATLGGVENAIASVRKNCETDVRYVRSRALNGKHFFTLHAVNGQAIGYSAMYESESGMDNGISSVMKNAPGAETEYTDG